MIPSSDSFSNKDQVLHTKPRSTDKQAEQHDAAPAVTAKPEPKAKECNEASRIQIGAIGKPHGIRGGFFLTGRDEPLEFRLDELPVILEQPSLREKGKGNGSQRAPLSPSIFKIQKHIPSNARDILILEGVTTRDAIESLRGSALFVRREDYPIDEESEFFWVDLVGRSIIDSNDKPFGTIVEVSNYGASDILLIHQGSKALDVPLVDQYFDMDFDDDPSTPLKLIVPIETFDECWIDR